MSFKVTCLCVIRIQNIWEMTMHSVKKIINFRCFTPVRRPSYRWHMGLSSLKFLYWAPKDASILQSTAIKVNDFGTNRKCVWYFLLVCHSNQGPIISDMLQLFGWKLQIFPILLSCGAPLRMFYNGTSCLRGEVYHDRSLSHFDTTPDRQTDVWI